MESGLAIAGTVDVWAGRNSCTDQFRKYPLAAGCALGAFVLWGGGPIVNQLAFYVFVVLPAENGQIGSDRMSLMSLFRGVTTLTNLVAYGLILFAVFGGRHESRGY